MLVKLSIKGRVLIPVSMRRKFRLRPGTDLQILDSGRVLPILANLHEFANGGSGTGHAEPPPKQKHGVEYHLG